LFRLFFAGELRPCTVDFHTIADIRERHFEPNRQTCGFRNRAVFRIEKCSTSERYDGMFPRGNPFQCVAFKLPEMGFAAHAKDIGYSAPLATLNFLIEVDEFPAEFLCQAPPNRGFSRPHEANEINAIDRHRTIYPFRPR